MKMFTVLSSWLGHYKSSLDSCEECRLSIKQQPSDQANELELWIHLWAVTDYTHHHHLLLLLRCPKAVKDCADVLKTTVYTAHDDSVRNTTQMQRTWNWNETQHRV